jgi:hypothetical protein
MGGAKIMNKLARFKTRLLFAAVVFAWQTASGCSANNQITRDAIGPIALGYDRIDIENLGYSFETMTEEYEGIEYEIFKIETQPNVYIIASFDASNKVSKLETFSPFFSTPDGARVGMSLGRLREIYPGGRIYKGASDAGLQFNFTGKFDHHVFVFDANKIGADCILNAKNCPADINSFNSIGFYMYKVSK